MLVDFGGEGRGVIPYSKIVANSICKGKYCILWSDKVVYDAGLIFAGKF